MVNYYFDIETTGLNPYKDRILTIQLKREHDDDIILWKIWEEENELSEILDFLEYIKSVRNSNSLYGYNILKFDIPFISARLNISSRMNSENHRILHYKKWIDLYQYMGANYISMDRWLHLFGIKRRCIFTGRDIPRLYRKKRIEEIEKHAKDDLVVCEKLVEKLRMHALREHLMLPVCGVKEKKGGLGFSL